jgi:hypothetical protein
MRSIQRNCSQVVAIYVRQVATSFGFWLGRDSALRSTQRFANKLCSETCCQTFWMRSIQRYRSQVMRTWARRVATSFGFWLGGDLCRGRPNLFRISCIERLVCGPSGCALSNGIALKSRRLGPVELPRHLVFDLVETCVDPTFCG